LASLFFTPGGFFSLETRGFRSSCLGLALLEVVDVRTDAHSTTVRHVNPALGERHVRKGKSGRPEVSPVGSATVAHIRP